MIDVHAHLTDEKIEPSLPGLIADMEKDGLEAVIDTGSCPVTSEKAYKNALCYERVYAAVGIHPEEYEKASERTFARLEEMYLSSEKVVAIGEIGLDYHYDIPKKEQIDLFERQINIASRLRAPVVLHVRDAYKDAYDILKNNENSLKNGILLHCYGGSKEMVKQFDKFDCYYSFGGVVTFKNATEKPDVVRAVPPGRLLLETDCPYMTPVPYRGTTNYPKYVVYTAQRIAEILGVPFENVCKTTTDNAKRLFGIR